MWASLVAENGEESAGCPGLVDRGGGDGRRDTGTDDPRVRSARRQGRVRAEGPLAGRPSRWVVVGIDRGRYQVSRRERHPRGRRARELGRARSSWAPAAWPGAPFRPHRRGRGVRRAAVPWRMPPISAGGRRRGGLQAPCIVVALADPPPLFGMIDRCLVARFRRPGLGPVLVLTRRIWPAQTS